MYMAPIALLLIEMVWSLMPVCILVGLIMVLVSFFDKDIVQKKKMLKIGIWTVVIAALLIVGTYAWILWILDEYL